MASGVMCPCCRMRSAFSSSPRKKAERRPSWASVASEATTGKSAGDPAVAGLQPPQRHDEARRHAVAALDLLQQGRVLQ